jgi:hypothetical protein
MQLHSSSNNGDNAVVSPNTKATVTPNNPTLFFYAFRLYNDALTGTLKTEYNKSKVLAASKQELLHQLNSNSDHNCNRAGHQQQLRLVAQLSNNFGLIASAVSA